MKVLVKSLIFTVLVPGTVTVGLPYLFLRHRTEIPTGVLRFMGAFPMALGAAVYFWCAWDFARLGRGTPAPIDPPKALVIRGLYRQVRNPMYVGVELILLGEALLFGSFRLLAYAALVWCVFNLFVIYYEEPVLRQKFGALYEEYCKSVPRWIPRMHPFRASPGPPAS